MAVLNVAVQRLSTIGAHIRERVAHHLSGFLRIGRDPCGSDILLRARVCPKVQTRGNTGQSQFDLRAETLRFLASEVARNLLWENKLITRCGFELPIFGL
jgi:hypothetical protein